MRYKFTGLQAATLKIMMGNTAFQYQRRWYIDQRRIRHITKTRQCGADWYFSLEGLIDAIETGRNQYFLAPTGAQASAFFRNRIAAFSAMAGVNIPVKDSLQRSAPPIMLSNGAELHFASPESLVSGASGNVYLSEYAWCKHPSRLFKMARGISCNNTFRFTAYTSPSKSDEAYSIWKNEHPDNKQRLSAQEAVRQGCTLLDIDQLQSELSADDFRLLFSATWPQEKNEVVK
ncbi:hypothetical protein AGJ37_09600 [Cronobacter sakazakii]|nr:hypothetical protein AGJ37_09600 [Cronobacter sakazakii]HDU8041286.1 terminase family protein [Cronobacter sakazakii]